MNQLIRKTPRYLIAAVLILALVAALFPAMEADAATKSNNYRKIRPSYTAYDTNNRLKLCGKYFYAGDDGYFCGVAVASSKTGKGKVVAKGTNDTFLSDSPMFTNGNTMFYVKSWPDYGEDEIWVGNTISETNHRACLPMTGDHQGITLVNVYNGYLYYLKSDWDKEGAPNLYRTYYANEPQRPKKYGSSFDYLDNTSRYIYLKKHGDDYMRVFDCKTNKFVKLSSGKMVYTGHIQEVKIKGNYLYQLTCNQETGAVKLYRSSLSGKNKKLVVTADKYGVLEFNDSNFVYYKNGNIKTYKLKSS